MKKTGVTVRRVMDEENHAPRVYELNLPVMVEVSGGAESFFQRSGVFVGSVVTLTPNGMVIGRATQDPYRAEEVASKMAKFNDHAPDCKPVIALVQRVAGGPASLMEMAVGKRGPVWAHHPQECWTKWMNRP